VCSERGRRLNRTQEEGGLPHGLEAAAAVLVDAEVSGRQDHQHAVVRQLLAARHRRLQEAPAPRRDQLASTAEDPHTHQHRGRVGEPKTLFLPTAKQFLHVPGRVLRWCPGPRWTFLCSTSRVGFPAELHSGPRPTRGKEEAFHVFPLLPTSIAGLFFPMSLYLHPWLPWGQRRRRM